MRVIVIGGYGFFGERLCRLLAKIDRVSVCIAGRDARRASALAAELGATSLSLDAQSLGLATLLRTERAEFVIHTGGPFQHQAYHVAQACIAAGAHYVDLADARAFVCGIGALDATARAAGVAIVSGASTLPALSSAVIDALSSELTRVDAIRIGVSPANRTERGLATVRAGLSYCGRPIETWRNGARATTFGWSDLARYTYPAPVGVRWHAAVDVPDTTLFPVRYAGVRDISARFGLELPILQFGMVAFSALGRIGLVRDWSRYARPLKWLGDCLIGFGSGNGGMHVEVDGLARDGSAITRRWVLVARDNHGPYVPTLAAAALVRQALEPGALRLGASPCVGLLSLAAIEREARGLGITTITASLSPSPSPAVRP
ncbi:MAG: saccharopine dehydrogenase NADP-binding domain-containing protein [Burkholderiales bacterium]